MGPLEEAVRYTTWFSKVSDQVIPFYLFIVFSTFLLWLLLSYILRSPVSTRRGSSPSTLDRETGTFSTLSDALPFPASTATYGDETPLFESSTVTSVPFLRLWLIRLLLVPVTIIFYFLHQDIVVRLKWKLYPALALCIFLNVVQTFHARSVAATSPRSNGGWRVLNFVRALLTSARSLAMSWLPQRRAFLIQSVVTAVVLAYVALVFATNEPLSRPVPSVGLPRKMCSSPLPAQDFAKTFAEYVNFHNNMLQKPMEDQRILIYHTVDEGLGNRLEGLVSAFALAMVTNRAFIIDWRAQSKCNAKLEDLFEKPGFAWQVDWRHVGWDKGKREGYYYAYCRACPLRTRNPDGTEAWEKLLCEENAGFDSTSRIVSIKSTQWFAPVLAMNPHLGEKFCKIFGSDLYATVAPYILKLNNELTRRKESFKKENGWTKDQEVVSLQIRRLEGFGISDDIADTFLKCGAVVSQQANTKFFLATDHIPTRQQFKTILMDRLIHLDSTFDRGSKRGIQDAVVELWLLGEANNMIMSPYSTFGDIAHARTGLIPHKVSRNGSCNRQLTSHPCFFYYFGMFDLKCFNKNMVLAELTNQEDCYNY